MVSSVAVHTDTMELYWNDIRHSTPLGRADEVALFSRVRQGDEGARERVVRANLRFVVRIAKEYGGRGLSLSELVSEGNMGLLEAVSRFDEERGFKFITFAVHWIRQAIQQALGTEGRALRLPMSRVVDLSRISKTTTVRMHQVERELTTEEMAELAGITETRVVQALARAGRDTSFDTGIGEYDDGSTLLDLYVADGDDLAEQLEQRERAAVLQQAMDCLDARERLIVERHFGLGDCAPATLETLGDELGLTRERIRQLRNRALGKMKRHLEVELAGDAL